jgi:uroporphyrin-III C-methyltransferase
MSVHLVGAGPGSADLLTVRAARLISEATVVVTDRLVDDSVLRLIPKGVEVIDVGKRPGCSNTQDLINELLISLGRQHDCVVRLKGGDPFVFGRGGEEALALRSAGLDVEIIPGVTSALSGPLAAGIPVTHRNLAWGVTVVTGHTLDGSTIDFTRLANPELTLVVLMGVGHRAEISEQLLVGGLEQSTPVAVVESAWTPTQRVVRGRLDELGSLEVSSPAVLVIGPAAALDVAAVSELAASAVQ